MPDQLVRPDQDRPSRLIRSAEGMSFAVGREATVVQLRELFGASTRKATKKRRKRK